MRQDNKIKNGVVSNATSECARKAMKRAARNKVFAVVAVVVAAFTVFALAQPAITLTYNCGMDEHVHAEDCYTSELVCENQEPGHEHSDACYSKQLTCTVPEHVHSDECTVKEDGPQQDAAPGEADAPAGDEGAAEDPQEQPDAMAPAAADGERGNPAPELTGNSFVIYHKDSNKVMVPKVRNGMLEGALATSYSQTNGEHQLVLPDGLNPVWTFVENNGNVYLAAGDGTASSYLTGWNGSALVTKLTSDPQTPVRVTEEPDGAYRLSLAGQMMAAPVYYSTSDGDFHVGNPFGRGDKFILVPAGNVTHKGDIVAGMTPPGTTVNLFDYWATPDRIPPANGDQGTNYPQGGINAGHRLKFGNGGTDLDTERFNNYDTQNKGLVKDIVERNLLNGYPRLKLNKGGESLAYLFDPSHSDTVEGKKSFANVGGLFRRDKDGYYYYDCEQNYAELNEASNQMTLYNGPGVDKSGSGVQKGQFFPFNEYAKASAMNSSNPAINHHFGMTLSTRFVQRNGGHTDVQQKTDMVFEFSGDDDVWIFIDGALVADMGGMRDKASVKINFATGKIQTECAGKTEELSLRDQFRLANVKAGWSEDGLTFADNTYHTLNFFYLERGAYDSDLYLKYNLKSVPVTQVEKVDQYGRDIDGARFAVYAANENYEYRDGKGGNIVSIGSDYWFDTNGDIVIGPLGFRRVKALYTGVTRDGHMVFADQNGGAYTLAELKEMFGRHFILREYGVPEGYRITGEETRLEITDSNLLVCNNSYDNGSYAAANLIATATNDIWLNTKNKPKPAEATDAGQGYAKLQYFDAHNKTSKGTLFSVVMKYEKPQNVPMDLSNESHWHPIYGSAAAGYKTVKESEGRLIARSIAAAKKAAAYGQVAFELTPSGAMEVSLDNLPGDITSYYYTLGPNEKENTRFSVAYYWTQADSVEGATADNTWQVGADENEPEGNQGFGRIFGSKIAVPNIYNRLVVQKRSDGPQGDTVNGANFALYEVEETRWLPGDISYKATDGKTLVKLNDDGTATVEGTSHPYTIDGGNGLISIADTPYTIAPAMSADYTSLLETTASEPEGLKGEHGIASFKMIKPGNYVLREVKAPEGHLLNPAESLVKVTRNGVYACAGTADDGIRVGRGPGYIVDTMREYAIAGEVNMTLQWIVTMLRVHNNPNGVYSFNDFTQDQGKSWPFLKNETGETVEMGSDENSMRQQALRTYLKYDTGLDADRYRSYSVDSDAEYEEHQSPELAKYYGPGEENRGDRRMYTETGWSVLEVYQDYWYGATKMEGKSAVYKNLVTGVNKPDLSRLFSRSVTVEFSDPRVSNLKIGMTIESDKVDPNKEFAYNVTLTDGADAPLSKEYGYVIYNADGSMAKSGSITPGEAWQFNLKSGQYAEVKDLPVTAQVTAVQTLDGQYSTTHTVNGSEAKVGGTTEKTPMHWKMTDAGVDNTCVIHYVNTLVKPVDIVLRKTDASLNAPLGGAQFVLYREVAGQPREYFDPKWSVDRPIWSKLGAGENESKFQFALGEKAIYKLPNNATYYLKELKAPNGHLALEGPVRFNILNGKISNVYYKDAVQPNWVTVNSGSTIEVLRIPNSVGAVLPNAGGPGTAGFTVGGVALLAMTLVIGFVFKRSRGREDSA